MPNRRGFLGGLSATLGLLWLPGIWLPDDDDWDDYVIEDIDEPRRSSLPDCLLDFMACGLAQESQVAQLFIKRPDGNVLLGLAMNARGGIVQYRSAPGQELHGELRFVVPANIRATAVGVQDHQYISDVYEPGVPIQRVNLYP